MKTTIEKRAKENVFTEKVGYDAYRTIKSQLGYFYREGLINKTQKELLEKPQYALSCTLPIRRAPGQWKVLNGFFVKHGRSADNFISRIIYDPEVTLEKLKAIALSDHLRARLAEIPLEPLPVGIDCDRETLSSHSRSEIEALLKEAILTSSGFNGTLEAPPTDSTDHWHKNIAHLSEHCFTKMLVDLKDLLFPDREKVMISSTGKTPFTKKVYELLPESDFEVLAEEKERNTFKEVFILSDLERLHQDRVRDIKTRVIVNRSLGAVPPEIKVVLAERNIILVPNIITSLPAITWPYLIRTKHEFRHKERNDIRNYTTRVTTKALRDAWRLANQRSFSLTSAAFALAIKRSAKIQSCHSPVGLQTTGDKSVK